MALVKRIITPHPRSKYGFNKLAVDDFFYVGRDMEANVRSAVSKHLKKVRKKTPDVNISVNVTEDGKLIVRRTK